MIKLLMKNFGLTILGLCIVSTGAMLDMRLDLMETKLNKAMAVNDAVSQYADTINLSQLREAEVVAVRPQHKPQIKMVSK